MKKATYTSSTVITCEARVTTLSCGCKEIDPMAETVPEKGWPCSECGKRHRPGAVKNMRYEDCPQHAEFFRYWDGIFTGFLVRAYHTGDCPQFFIKPSKALSGLIKAKAKDKSSERTQKLIDILASQRGKAASHYASMAACALEGIIEAQCNQLAWAVTRYHDAKAMLTKSSAAGAARWHLRWVVARWLAALLAVQFVGAALVIAAWVWHLPDWHTVMTLATTALGSGVFFPVFKEWFMQRRLGFGNMDDE